VIWRSEGRLCSHTPQWSPDGHWIVFSITPAGDWSFPMTRQVAILARDGSTKIPAVTIIHKDEDCIQPEVALSPDSKQVAYIDDDCKPRIQTYGFVGDNYLGLSDFPDDFPIWWTSAVHPQWGGLDKE
jgi:Tol biopolymer transport system component